MTVTDIKWLSVWCRRFQVNFGDLFFPEDLMFDNGTSGTLNCSSQSCLNDPSCLDKCLDGHGLFDSDNEASGHLDCSSQSCLNDPSCLDKCLEKHDLFGFDDGTSGKSNCSLQSCLT